MGTRRDAAQTRERAGLGVQLGGCDHGHWLCRTELRKWHSREDGIHLWTPPDELEVVEGNLLTYGGASIQWQTLLGTAGAGTGALAFFNNANTRMAIGSSATAEAAGQQDMQTPVARIAMDSGYPAHTDSATLAAANTVTFRATALDAVANAVWAEWGLANAATGGRLLNRRVQALGTKTSGSWQLTVTLTLA
jgi:hypothetical protein